MLQQINELCALLRKHAPDGAQGLPVPRAAIKIGTSRTSPAPGLYQPMMGFLLQGTKRLTVGSRTFEYSGASFMVASVDLPATGCVVQASPEKPYIALALTLDPQTVAGVLLDLPAQSEGDPAAGFAISPLTPDLLDPLARMARLMDAPQDVSVMGPMLEREIIYRALQGPQAGMLRQAARCGSRLSQIRKAVTVIRRDFAAPLRIEALAAEAGMSASSFHRHFKAVTAMSPLQYQKQIRLQIARRRLVTQPGEAARVAYEVGYESPSQFSREYARLFGLPPARDAARLRAAGPLEEA
jgi:AraC-like DNA-binding protein